MNNSLAEHILKAQTYIDFLGSYKKYAEHPNQKEELSKTECLEHWVEISESYWKLKEADITDLVITTLSREIIDNDYK